ncbi:MAG TPA: NAD-dependent epimerase/dehydratase family protein [Vicinamibacterales bacterium]|nr:NAD-dependent epimerase/dehydratase family protein [Vicinamibacterales bacterium]
MTRRIAVTGASGFIGGHLTSALIARGDTVTPIRRPFRIADLSEKLRSVDTIVHLAGVVSAVHERDFYMANVDATRAVARAAQAAGARLIHISSLAAAGPSPGTAPRSEEDSPAPITPYGRSKLEGERCVTETPDLRWTILRPGVVYGSGDRAMRPLFRMAEHRVLPLVGRTSAAYMFIHIDDLLRALISAIDVDHPGDTIFVGHPSAVTARELLETIRAVVEPRALIVPVPLALMRLAAAFGDLGGWISGRPAVINRWRYAELASEGFVCRVDRMRERLHVEPRIGLTEGITKTARPE